VPTSGAPAYPATSSGISNPTFSASYRYLDDDARTGLSSDVVLAASPSLTTREVSTTTQSGNDARGYGTMNLSAPLYWWYASNEIEVDPTVTRQFGGSGTSPIANNSYTRSSDWVGNASFADRFHVTQDFFAEVIANFTLPNTANYVYGSGTAGAYTNPFYIEPSLVVGYKLKSNARLDLRYDYFNFTTSGTYGTGSSTNKFVQGFLSARFLFQI
jgi:hypothetical protein